MLYNSRLTPVKYTDKMRIQKEISEILKETLLVYKTTGLLHLPEVNKLPEWKSIYESAGSPSYTYGANHFSTRFDFNLQDSLLKYPDIIYREDKDSWSIPSRNYIVNEMSLKTWPVDKTLRYLHKVLKEAGLRHKIAVKSSDIILRSDTDFKNYNNPSIDEQIKISVDYEDVTLDTYDIINNVMTICGYYFVRHYVATNYIESIDDFSDYDIVEYEGRYQSDISDELPDTLYHITTKTIGELIKKNGIVPKSQKLSKNQRRNINYPERIYFFKNYDPDNFAYYIHQSGLVNKTNVDNKLEISNDYVIVTIDRTKLNSVNWFEDRRYENGIACFTYDNIPVSAIVSIEDFDLKIAYC